MARTPKTSRVERTRAGGMWTEASFWAFVRSHMRAMSLRWPPIHEAKRRVRVPYDGPDKRRKWMYLCQQCGHLFDGKDVRTDHIVECGTIKSFEDAPGFLERMLVEVDGLQVLCHQCHHNKTISYNQEQISEQ
jgi:5-methylcytosine-specific restriction endonuclease McrA